MNYYYDGVGNALLMIITRKKKTILDQILHL